MEDFTILIHVRAVSTAAAHEAMLDIVDAAQNETPDSTGDMVRSGVIVRGNRITDNDVTEDASIAETADDLYIPEN